VKVLQINSVCGTGSTGRIATDIHSLLEKNGYESIIAFGRGVPQKCDNTIKIGSNLDNYKHVAITRLFDKHGFGSRKSTQVLIKKIKVLNPDVIHLHNIHGYYINIQVLFDFLKEINKPVVWTLHDCWPFTGHCAHFDYINCSKWKTECNRCPQKKVYPRSLLVDSSRGNFKSKRNIFTKLDKLTIVTPSIWLAELVAESFLKEYSVRVINNGIDLNIFQPVNSDFRKKYNLENKFVILGVANIWSAKKGFNYLVDLSKLLTKDEIIVVVGLSETQVNELQTNNIIGIPRTNNAKELAEIYSASDVFVNPSLEENFPTVNLESISTGTPIVTFDVGGSSEIFNNNIGFYVEKGNVRSMYNKINIIKKEGKSKYIDNCIETSKKYDSLLKYSEYIQLYEELSL